MALFITFEGGEGGGKSTQARILYRRLGRLGVPALLTHEPGVTLLGRRITRLLKWSHTVDISPMAELLLFNASRAQLVSEVIRPALEAGKTVICDRYADSTTAYQGYGRELDPATVAAANATGTLGLKPDLTILLDMPPSHGLARKQGRKDRFEMENDDFHRKVRAGFLELAAAEPQRWLVVDASKSKSEIAGLIWERVGKMILQGERVKKSPINDKQRCRG